MEKIKPFVRCVDYWPDHIPPEKLEAYQRLIAEGQIQKHHVIYNRLTGSTTVEYYAIMPHEWIREELRKAVGKTSEKQLMMDMETAAADEQAGAGRTPAKYKIPLPPINGGKGV